MSIRNKIVGALALAAVLGGVPAVAETPAPHYGGTLNIGGGYMALSPLTWDAADWGWKFQNDTGLMYEQLFAADLSKSKRNGGAYSFVPDGWLPEDATRGELAESWSWKQEPLRLEVKLRPGVMFPAKAGVMPARELVAADVVDSYDRLNKSPKKIPTYFDHVDKVEAVDAHAVVFTLNKYNAEWAYRFSWGYYSGIVPHEVVTAGAGNWRGANGSGPFELTDYVQGNVSTFTKNPLYWGTESIGGHDYKLPFADKIVYRVIRDEATQYASLRTGKLDLWNRCAGTRRTS